MKVNFVYYSLFIGFFFFSIQTQGQKIIKPSINSKTTFAIVIDNETFNKAQHEVIEYKQNIEKDGLGTYIISHNWDNPDEIRTILKKLYSEKSPLEGTVLIGNIPIVMIRDAQFMTSAFKMNQKIRWDKSSVPSDRFYDDFDLKLKFLNRDTANDRNNLYYYSLEADSPQYIEMDIYSARVKPPVEKGEDFSEKIKNYLQKINKIRSQQYPLKDMIASIGHGYNSNAINSVTSDIVSFKSQFPSLFKPGGSIKFLNFRNDTFMKFNLLRELKREGLDFAFMTGHGTATLQLINGYPLASNPQPSMENVARYLRSKIRDAKESGRDLEKVKSDFKNSLGVSDKWMNDAFDKSRIEEDSIFNENLDIQINDIKDAQIKAKFVYINSCLTGSFHLKNYLAGYYPFSDNQNITAVANSVGVLQDIWSTELLGLLQHGVRIGNWFKHIAYLETHIFGDPTFHFQSNRSSSINNSISTKANVSYWKNLLNENDADLKSLALIYLTKFLPEREVSIILKENYFNSPYESTRMEAFSLLRKFENECYFSVLHAAKNDPYEFIRRMVTYDLGEFGGDNFAKDVISMYISDPHSERINYKLRNIMDFYNPKALKEEINAQIKTNKNIINSDNLVKQLFKNIEYNSTKVDRMDSIIKNSKLPEKERLSEITTLRLYRYHKLVPTVLGVISNPSESEAIRVAALEAMGWFNLSYQRQNILHTCNQLLNDSLTPLSVKYQALKTKRRLKIG